MILIVAVDVYLATHLVPRCGHDLVTRLLMLVGCGGVWVVTTLWDVSVAPAVSVVYRYNLWSRLLTSFIVVRGGVSDCSSNGGGEVGGIEG